jgi:hypothetical protein
MLCCCYCPMLVTVMSEPSNHELRDTVAAVYSLSEHCCSTVVTCLLDGPNMFLTGE